MKSIYSVRFDNGATDIGPFKLTIDEARLKAFEVAKSTGFPQTLKVYSNEHLCWNRLSTYYPEGFCIDNLNCVNVLNDSNNGLYMIGKLGEEYTREYVMSRQNTHAHIINAAQNKIEYDNGLLFVYDFRKKTYHLSVKKGGKA